VLSASWYLWGPRRLGRLVLAGPSLGLALRPLAHCRGLAVRGVLWTLLGLLVRLPARRSRLAALVAVLLPPCRRRGEHSCLPVVVAVTTTLGVLGNCAWRSSTRLAD
jgi:hypothetical protein